MIVHCLDVMVGVLRSDMLVVFVCVLVGIYRTQFSVHLLSADRSLSRFFNSVHLSRECRSLIPHMCLQVEKKQKTASTSCRSRKCSNR